MSPSNRHLLNLIALFILLATPLLTACDAPANATRGDITTRKIKVVATTGMIADLAQTVGGDRVEVHGLMGPGVDPHLYQAKPSDTDALSGADIIFYNGLHLEGKMVDLLEKMSEQRPTIAVTREIPEEKLRKPIAFEGNYDPHVWFDVSMWSYTVGVVEAELTKLDPTSAALYKANADRYRTELADLHTYALTQLATIPQERRVLITAHDAFGYFGLVYGLDVRGLQGTSTASEPGPADVQALAAYIAERGVKAIFVESSVPARTIEAVQAAVQAQNHSVTIGGQLFSDALGATDSPEGHYIGMVRYNVNTIVAALK